ncbi:hypothetical protein HY439_00060 [Candidatus Microgenomates bacterium]|nr:hypothetical protein [Candidatus Microgenomates bacterium]
MDQPPAPQSPINNNSSAPGMASSSPAASNSPTSTSTAPEMKGANKPLVRPATIFIFVLLLGIVGAVFFIVGKNKFTQPAPLPTRPPAVRSQTTPTPASDLIESGLRVTNPSDEVSVIEGDINSTNLDNLDEGVAGAETNL